MITGQTKIAGLIGGPSQVARSISPQIHNAAFAETGLGWIYVPFGVTNRVGPAIEGLLAAGVRGLNVTMPHKVDAMSVVDELSADAAAAGAINTIVVQDGRTIGHNTDGPGFMRYLTEDIGMDIVGKSVLIIGSGGAARSVVASVARAGASEVLVAARSISRAQDLRGAAGEASFSVHPLPVDDVLAGRADLIVNATPLGQAEEEVPLPVGAIRREAVLVDLIYNPHHTKLIEHARAAKVSAHPGLGMLLHQAALSFELWTSVRAPLQVMSAAAIQALTRDRTG